MTNCPTKLVYTVPLNRSALCRPFGFPHHPLAQQQDSSWDLGNAERPSIECHVAGEAHLMLRLLHHLTLRVSCSNSQLDLGFGETHRCATSWECILFFTLSGAMVPPVWCQGGCCCPCCAGGQVLATDGR